MWTAKTQISLGINSQDSDQTGRMPRLICVFAGRTFILLVLSCHGSCQDVSVGSLYWQDLGIHTTQCNQDLVSKSKLIVLAVKPHIVRLVLQEVSQQVSKEKIIVSIAAGIPISAIEKVEYGYMLSWQCSCDFSCQFFQSLHSQNPRQGTCYPTWYRCLKK